MIILEMILMGIFATYFMDFLARLLVKRKIIFSLIEPEVIGRWFLSMFRGKFIHEDIHKTPELKNEKLRCFLSHYLIGIVLTGIYLVLGHVLARLEGVRFGEAVGDEHDQQAGYEPVHVDGQRRKSGGGDYGVLPALSFLSLCAGEAGVASERTVG